MVKREENRTILPQSLSQSSRLSIKEPKQDVVPPSHGFPPAKPQQFSNAVSKQSGNVGKEKDCRAVTLSS